MKHSRILAFILSIIGVLNFSNAFAQGHVLQVDDGSGNYSILRGSNPGGTFFLPAGPGSFTLLTTNSGWAVAGNTLTGGLPTTPNEFFGSNNNFDVVMKSAGTERLRIGSTGTLSVTGNLNVSGGSIRGYLDIADASSPAAPLSFSIYRINSNGANATRATITLPAGAANGSTVVLATNDPDGGQELTTGYAFSNTVSVRFVKFSDGWRPEF